MRRRTNNRQPTDPWNVAVRLLAHRDYATGELRRNLLAKGFADEAVEEAIARGVALGLVDDARYAGRLVRTLLDSGRAAGPRLAMELRRRGLAEDLIEAATSECRAAGQEDTALHTLVARRFASFNYAEAAPEERRRVVNFLQRRGFPLDCILNELKRTD